LGGVLLGFRLFCTGNGHDAFGILCGFIAGQLRTLALDKEEIWSFSPLSISAFTAGYGRNLPRPRLFDWQFMFFVTIVALRFVHTELTHFSRRTNFQLGEPNPVG